MKGIDERGAIAEGVSPLLILDTLPLSDSRILVLNTYDTGMVSELIGLAETIMAFAISSPVRPKAVFSTR